MHSALTWVNGKFLKKKLKKTIIYFLIYIHLHDGKKSKDLTFRGKVTIIMPHQSKVEEWTKGTFSNRNISICGGHMMVIILNKPNQCEMHLMRYKYHHKKISI